MTVSEFVQWPVVTVQAQNQAEVDCLLYAFGQAGIACLMQSDFGVEVGGATINDILNVVQECLTRNDIESVRVVFAERPTQYLLRR